MLVLKCKMCGGNLEINEDNSIAICEYCKTKQTLPKLNDEKKVNLYDRANYLRRNNEFDKASNIYEQLLNEDSTDSEIYWSLVLCHYGIEYVEDPKTHKRLPTMNRTQFTSIFDDNNYKLAIANADNKQKEVYEEEAKVINEIQKNILSISQREEAFDVFICYKETDENGRRTQDSVLANDLYHGLTQEGFKVFFSRITLEDKLGTAYEPYIFAALNSAKVMVVIGTRPEYFNAVWVKNEWSRFLGLIKKGEKKTIVPAYKDMNPYDLPEEFSHLQAQDMSKLGFMQDLIRGIKKIIGKEEKESNKKSNENIKINTDNMVKRAFIFLEDQNWKNADEYFEKVLDEEPENAKAYLGKMMIQLHVKREEDLLNLAEPLEDNSFYNKIIRYADDELKEKLKDYNKKIIEKSKKEKLDKIYDEASTEEPIITRNANKKIRRLKNALLKLEEIPNYKDSAIRIEKIKKEIEDITRETKIQKEKKRKIILRTIIFVISICIILVICTNVIIPEIKYKNAEKLVSEEKYEDALKVYQELDSYRKTEEKIKLTTYLLAVKQMENKEYINAYNNFLMIKDYKDSSDIIKEYSKKFAEELIANKQFKKAVELIEDNDEYKELLNKCYIEAAQHYYDNKKYEEAMEWYEKADSYDKNSELYKEICYNFGLSIEIPAKTKKYEYAITKKAITIFSKTNGYKDSNEKIKELKYKYVQNNYVRDNRTTHEFLKELKEENYLDSVQLFESLYTWNVEVVVNDLENDSTTNKTSLSKYSQWYFHVKVTGGEPNEGAKFKYTGYFPNGTTSSGKWDFEFYNNDESYCCFWYENPAYGSSGTFKCVIQDEKGKFVAEKTVQITNW